MNDEELKAYLKEQNFSDDQIEQYFKRSHQKVKSSIEGKGKNRARTALGGLTFLKAYKDAYPGEALGYELAGGLLTGGAGLGRVAVAQGASRLKNLAKMAGTGAAGGAVYGAGEADPGSRAVGALAGGTVGAIANPIASKIPDVARSIYHKATDTPQKQADRIVGGLLRADFDTPIEASNAVRRLGDEGRLIHAGDSLTGGGEYAYGSVGSRARKQIKRELTDLQQQQSARIDDRLMTGINPERGRFLNQLKALNQRRSAEGRPLYDAAEQAGLTGRQPCLSAAKVCRYQNI
jgi:hypothetical protein